MDNRVMELGEKGLYGLIALLTAMMGDILEGCRFSNLSA
jgi:hypothetical protein